jgi:hypothetical protein
VPILHRHLPANSLRPADRLPVLRINMSWIKTIEPEDATGELKVEYDKAIQRAGKVFNILKVQTRKQKKAEAHEPSFHSSLPRNLA